jgi:hypothetical protein
MRDASLSPRIQGSREPATIAHRLAVVIPAFNEAKDLPSTLAALPRGFHGIDEVFVVVVDDGSTDDTLAVAKNHGADHVVRHPVNRGLSRAYMTGVTVALRGGATVIVQTDADGQYDARDIPALLRPVLDGSADLVVGTRTFHADPHNSWLKRIARSFGGWVVRVASGTTVMDSPSGFRCMTASTARQLHVHNTYSYTLETVIQAGRSGFRVASVPVRVTGPTRQSRLMTSWPSYVRKQTVTVLRIAFLYRPFRSFATIGLVALVSGLVLAVSAALGAPRGVNANVGMLIVAGLLTTFAFQALMTAFLADAIASNRRLIERLIDLELRKDSPDLAV